jgi:glutamate N-acetyltransferase / amino-acid N-acetyltransferase
VDESLLPQGFRFGGARCGLKNKRNDVGILVSDRPARAAGVFTTNFVHAACVDFSRNSLQNGQLQAVVVNSGNANCCTGEQGIRDTRQMAELAAKALNIDVEDIAVASTGVIGHLLDMSKVETGVAKAAESLGPDPRPFMEAILTTDLVEKEAHATIAGTTARVYGVAKGSGMIAPNMATMLSFLATDVDATQVDLSAILKRAANTTFNCMTVDGDTSTNDMLIVLANGASGESAPEAAIEAAIHEVCLSLARQIARDGEGATKLVEVRVTGTANPTKIARTIAESPLVKTAMFGCDPNWGRILMAAGRAGVEFHIQDVHLALELNGERYPLFESGSPASFDAKEISTALKSDHVLIDLHLGEGDPATIYTCDLGYGYVRINAEYHT